MLCQSRKTRKRHTLSGVCPARSFRGSPQEARSRWRNPRKTAAQRFAWYDKNGSKEALRVELRRERTCRTTTGPCLRARSQRTQTGAAEEAQAACSVCRHQPRPLELWAEVAAGRLAAWQTPADFWARQQRAILCPACTPASRACRSSGEKKKKNDH